jgi:hypothetical protein
MNARLSMRHAALVFAVGLALVSAGCQVVAGVGVGYGYPGAWGGYGGTVGGWHGGPAWP